MKNKSKKRNYSHRKAVQTAKTLEGGICAICGSSSFLEGHHLIEHSLNGANHHTNIVILCKVCHNSVHKQNITIIRENY